MHSGAVIFADIKTCFKDDDEDKMLVLIVDGDGVSIRRRVTQRLGDD